MVDDQHQDKIDREQAKEKREKRFKSSDQNKTMWSPKYQILDPRH